MPKRKANIPFHTMKRRKVQYGEGNIRVFRTQPLQRGYGLGGLFRGLFRTIAPVLKKSLVRVGQHALKAGSNALGDVASNDSSFKDALKKHVKKEIQSVNPINRLLAAKNVSTPTRRKRSTSRKLKPIKGFRKITL